MDKNVSSRQLGCLIMSVRYTDDTCSPGSHLEDSDIFESEGQKEEFGAMKWLACICSCKAAASDSSVLALLKERSLALALEVRTH